MPSVTQPWVQELRYMQQSVLLSTIRGPDTLHKEHVAKYILRWFRRCILLSSFEARVLESPTQPGGGSFTGPVKLLANWQQHADLVERGNALPMSDPRWARVQDLVVMDAVMREYLRATDEVPHHFHLHLVHASQILGYKHPDDWKRSWWRDFYLACCADMHMMPETESAMDRRLSDSEFEWRAREAVPAADVPRVRGGGDEGRE